MDDVADEANVRSGADGADDLPAYLRKQARQPQPLARWPGSGGRAWARVLALTGGAGALLLALVLVVLVATLLLAQ
jgi:hypothetical protein